jgi:4-amino-4-deoxy-L-arabinose transferase-like glycosyltransferase
MSSISILQSWNPAWSEATGVTVRPATKANWMSAAFLIAIVPLIFSFMVTRRLDHDEHQFVASAALLARHAELPYRDYPYFHTPGLVFVDALLFRFTNHLLLAARLVSFVGGLATNFVICFAARMALKDRGPMFAFCGAAIATLVVMTNPMFVATEGRAWNHDLPVFFTLLAFLFACSPRRYNGTTAWMLLVGFLVGVTISARLTFAPIVPVFAAIAWINSRSANRRAALLRYVIGLAIGLSPALFFLVTSPQQFLFGNFDYPMLSTAYWITMGNKTAAQPLAKLLFVLGHFVCEPENLFLIGAGTMDHAATIFAAADFVFAHRIVCALAVVSAVFLCADSVHRAVVRLHAGGHAAAIVGDAAGVAILGMCGDAGDRDWCGIVS